MLDVKVQPVSVFPDTASVLRVIGANIRQLGDGGSAIVAWQLLDDAGNPVKSGGLMIGGDEYNAWGSDDSYLASLMVTKLGLTPVIENPT